MLGESGETVEQIRRVGLGVQKERASRDRLVQESWILKTVWKGALWRSCDCLTSNPWGVTGRVCEVCSVR